VEDRNRRAVRNKARRAGEKDGLKACDHRSFGIPEAELLRKIGRRRRK